MIDATLVSNRQMNNAVKQGDSLMIFQSVLDRYFIFHNRWYILFQSYYIHFSLPLGLCKICCGCTKRSISSPDNFKGRVNRYILIPMESSTECTDVRNQAGNPQFRTNTTSQLFIKNNYIKLVNFTTSDSQSRYCEKIQLS